MTPFAKEKVVEGLFFLRHLCKDYDVFTSYTRGQGRGLERLRTSPSRERDRGIDEGVHRVQFRSRFEG